MLKIRRRAKRNSLLTIKKLVQPQKRPVTKNATSLICLAPRPGLEPGTNRLTVLKPLLFTEVSLTISIYITIIKTVSYVTINLYQVILNTL